MPQNSNINQITKKLLTGFTITELLIGIFIIGVLTAVAVPSLGDFILKLRVNNEISELHRLLLTARNSAVNSGKNVTVCPLSGTSCSTNWRKELSVFTNDDNSLANNKSFDSTTEELIKVKAKVTSGDDLKFSQNIIIFSPTGHLFSGGNGHFSYCPKGNIDLSRGINISLSGRLNTTSDTDNDNKDEHRDGTDVSCS